MLPAPFMPYGMVPPQDDNFAAPQGFASLPEMAGAASGTLKSIMRVEPMVAGMAGMFLPQVALVQPWIIFLAPQLEGALDAISKGNNGDVLKSLLDLAQHISKNGINSPYLSPPSTGPSQDPSAQGSG